MICSIELSPAHDLSFDSTVHGFASLRRCPQVDELFTAHSKTLNPLSAGVPLN